MSRSRKVLLYLAITAISWILVLTVPPLRTMFLAQTFRGGSNLPSAIPGDEPNFTNLAQENPQNLSLRLAEISQQKQRRDSRQFDFLSNIPDVPVPDEKDTQKEFEQLVKDFPNSPLPVYAFLNYSMTRMSPIREAGRLSDPEELEHIKEGVPSPERSGKRNYTQMQWQDVISLCKKGETIDPQNGYFDIMEAYWQFAEFHDEAGWKALRRAVQKPEINNYSLQFGQQGISAYKDGFDRNLMWEEIVAYSQPFSLSYGFGSTMRQLTRWLVWEGIKKEKQGKDDRALEMYGQTFQLAYKVKKSGKSLIANLIGIALEGLATSGPHRFGIKVDVPHEKDKTMYQVRRKNAAFAKYANEHGRPDIAKFGTMALKDYQAEMAMVNNKTMDHLQKPFLLPAFTGFLLWRIGVLLLWLLTGAAIIGVIASLASKVLLQGDRKLTLYKEYDFWRGAVSFAALPASLILIAGYAFSLVWELNHRTYDSYADMIFFQFLSNNQTLPSWMAFIGVATPVIFSIAYCWHRAAKNHQRSGAPKVLLWKRVLGVVGSLFFVLFWAAMASGEFPVHIRTGRQSFIDLFFITYFGVDSFTVHWKSIVYLSAVFVVLGILIYLWNRIVQIKRRSNAKSTFADFVQLLSQSSLRFVALASVLYLLTLAIAIPIRAPLHKREMIKATQGEIVFYRDVLSSR